MSATNHILYTVYQEFSFGADPACVQQYNDCCRYDIAVCQYACVQGLAGHQIILGPSPCKDACEKKDACSCSYNC